MITHYFLRAKHWQILIYVVGLMLCAAAIDFRVGPSTQRFGGLSIVSWVLTGLGEGYFLTWLWSLGSFLASVAGPALKLKVGFFRFALIYHPLYLFTEMVFLKNLPNWLFATLIPLHALAVYCMFYSIYFVSKSLLLVENAKPTSFYSNARASLLFLFFPIGVWFVQPKINRLYAERGTGELLASR